MSTLRMPKKESLVGSFLSAAFWVAATAGFAFATYHSSLPFGPQAWASYSSLMKEADAHPAATVYTLVWTAMVIAGLGAMVRRVVGVPGKWGASVAITLGAIISLSQSFQISTLTTADVDRGALLMMAAALAFAGASRLWWLVLAPVLAAVTIAPLAWLEFWEAVGSGVLMRAAIPAVASAIVASLIVVVRETRARVLEARNGIHEVTAREEKVATDLVKFTKSMTLRERREDVQAAPETSLQEAVEATSLVIAPEDVLHASKQTTTVEIEPPAAAQTASSVTYQDLQALANESLEAVRVKWAGSKEVRFLLTAPSDLSLPIAVRGNNDEVRVWMRSLVENAVDALGGGRGVVRLSLRPTLTHVAISVEDNGRGLGEDLYSKLGVEDPARMKLVDVKKQAAKVGARLDLHSRLGVGTRATLELSRIDALSALSRAARANEVRTSAVRTSPDSNSMHA